MKNTETETHHTTIELPPPPPPPTTLEGEEKSCGTLNPQRRHYLAEHVAPAIVGSGHGGYGCRCRDSSRGSNGNRARTQGRLGIHRTIAVRGRESKLENYPVCLPVL